MQRGLTQSKMIEAVKNRALEIKNSQNFVNLSFEDKEIIISMLEVCGVLE